MVRIIDTTLRDGEQSPGVAFSLQEKLLIARLLDRLGVYQIEAGTPVMGSYEQMTIAAINKLGLKCRISTWNRMNLGDIRASLQCGSRDIHIAVPVSDIQIKYKLKRSRLWVLDCLKRALRYGREYECRMTVGAEDASRADYRFLLEIAQTAAEQGAERLRYCDTVGVLDPIKAYDHLTALKHDSPVEIEFHGHNDFGMAAANTLAAIEAGVQYVDTTVAGLGERAGNCAMETLDAILEDLYNLSPLVKKHLIKPLSIFVLEAGNRSATTNNLIVVQNSKLS